ncbi:MAG: ATP-binding cassette domain-containing protein [Flavobacteriales bacterium]
MGHFLSIEHVSKHYGNHTALHDVSLAVEKAQIFGLLGPNGAGKTSLIRIVNQISAPDSGSVRINGERLKPHHVQNIGYLPEARGLYRDMKVGEQALFFARLKGLDTAAASARVTHWFQRLGIQDWRHKKVQELSKGMAQKVQFVITVLHNPDLLIFDEPFSGFDPINADRIKDEILGLRDRGATVIFSTHRMESVEALCDHVALISRSRKILDGSVQAVKNRFKKHVYDVHLVPFEGKTWHTLAHFDWREKNNPPKYSGAKRIWVELKPEQSPNELLHVLMSIGTVRAFEESMPTMNEIFIEAVKQNAHE